MRGAWRQVCSLGGTAPSPTLSVLRRSAKIARGMRRMARFSCNRKLIGFFGEDRLDAMIPARFIGIEQAFRRGTAGFRDLGQSLQKVALVLARIVVLRAPTQAVASQPDHLDRHILGSAAAEGRFEPEAGCREAELFAFLQRPIAHEIGSRIERDAVIEQARPQRRQRAKPAPGAAIGAAHLEIAFQANLGKSRGEMIAPIADRRPFARKTGETAREEIAEGLPGDIDIAAVAVDEVHGNVEHVIDIALEAEPGFEDEGQQPGAVGVGVRPDMAAIAEIAARLAFDERRVGEERKSDRLEREAGAKLAHHVRFGIEIEIDLHGAGPEHHVEPELASERHIAPHDGIAALRHPGDILATRRRIEAQSQEPDAERVAHGAHLAQMLMHFVAGLMQRLERRTGKLELAARLERDRAARPRECHEIAGIEHRLPAEPHQALQESANAVGTVIGDAAMIAAAEDEFFVLRADAPLARWLAARGKIVDELPLVGDRRAAGERWSGHVPPKKTSRPPQCWRGARQSPASAWKAANAASAAVSARSSRGPRPTAHTKGSFLRPSSSASVKPPSGPVSTAHNPGGDPGSTSPMGGDAPLSSHSSNRRFAGQLARSRSSGSASRSSGTLSRLVCSAASTAWARRRSRLTRSTIVRWV